MKRLLRALIRWFWVLLIFVVLGYLGGKLAASLLPPQYEAIAYVQLDSSHGTGIVQPVDAYSADVSGNTILGPIYKQYPNLDPATFTTKQLNVTASKTGYTISIAVTLPKAKEAAAIANELATTLVQTENTYIRSQYAQQIAILNSRINAEQQEINKLDGEIIKTPTTDTTQIQQYQGDVDQQRNLQNQNIASLQSVQTDQTLYSAPLSVVQSASVPKKPSSIVGSIPIAPVVLIIMIVLGLCIIALLEQAANRINNLIVFQKKLQLPILGTLDWTRPSPDQIALDQLADMETPYAEQCRTMMANTLFYADENNAHIIVMMGSHSKAGTSTLAAELATLLAQSQRRVLLIDANMHSPTLHTRLSQPNDMGLAKMLQESRMAKTVTPPTYPGGNTATETLDSFPVDTYIQTTPIQGLYLVPAGQTTLSPSTLLSMSEMRLFITWASKRADFVIIDSPSVEYAESHILGTLGDLSMLVVDASKDRQKKIMNVKDELSSAGVRLSGIAVNKIGRLI
jgi:Mrp family chromosome partitioning ATPase